MLNVLNILQLVLYIALLALLGQGLLYVLAGAKRDGNFFYQLLQILSKPFTWVVRKITPNKVADHQVPIVTFFLLAHCLRRRDLREDRPLCRGGHGGLQVMGLAYLLLKLRPWSCWCSAATSRRWACSTRWCALCRAQLSACQPCPPACPGRPASGGACRLRSAACHAARDARTWFNKGFVLETAGPLGRGAGRLRACHRTQPEARPRLVWPGPCADPACSASTKPSSRSSATPNCSR